MDDAQLQQFLGSKAVALQRLPLADVYNRVFLAEDIGEPALGQTPVQRHLAAFKSAHPRVTRDGLGALGSAPGILSAPGAHTLAHALLLVLLPRGRFQLAEVHRVSLIRRSLINDR